jgi:hypothetical protein
VSDSSPRKISLVQRVADDAPKIVLPKTQRGATFIELALVLPLFFLLLFGVIDLARLALSFSAVRTAAVTAARRGAGQDRSLWTSFQAMGLGAGATVSPAALDAFTEFHSPNGDSGWYTTRLSGRGITFLYPAEVRGIAYGYRIISRSVGNVDYPCAGRPSCASCITVRGDNVTYTSIVTKSGETAPRPRLLGIECTQTVPILSSGLLGAWLPPVFEVAARGYANIENEDDSAYDR